MTAIKIDIETELEAIGAGQCGSCRIGLTHTPTESCYRFRENYAKMNYCNKCNHLSDANIFDYCPVCMNGKVVTHPITGHKYTL